MGAGVWGCVRGVQAVRVHVFVCRDAVGGELIVPMLLPRRVAPAARGHRSAEERLVRRGLGLWVHKVSGSFPHCACSRCNGKDSSPGGPERRLVGSPSEDCEGQCGPSIG